MTELVSNGVLHSAFYHIMVIVIVRKKAVLFEIVVVSNLLISSWFSFTLSVHGSAWVIFVKNMLAAIQQRIRCG